MEEVLHKKNAVVPKLRFKQKNGEPFPEWEEKEVGSFMTERKVMAPKSDDYPLMAFVAHIGVTHKGDRYNRDFLVSDVESKDYKQTEYGDFIYSSNNLLTGSIGLNLYGPASISPVYSIFEIGPTCERDFVANYLVRKSFLHKMVMYRQGVVYGQWRIHESDFLSIRERMPTLPEQQKIAAFLGAVDRKIQQLKRKQALLEQYKMGVVQQLFSQELRFKREDGSDYPEWEEKRLGDICSTFKSGEGITADEIDIGGEYPVYGGNGLRGFTDSFTHDGYYVLIGRQGALCGNINRVRGKVYISEHAIAVQCDKSSDTDWLAQLLTYMNLNRLSESSAQPGLAVNKLVQLKIAVPSLEEQSRIAGFLMALDAKVAGVAQAVSAAEKWKKGLLQQMFVQWS